MYQLILTYTPIIGMFSVSWIIISYFIFKSIVSIFNKIIDRIKRNYNNCGKLWNEPIKLFEMILTELNIKIKLKSLKKEFE